MSINFIGEAEIYNDYITLYHNLENSELGISASLAELDEIISFSSPPILSASGKSFLMENKMGFDVMTSTEVQNSWIVNDFLEFCLKKEEPILDIGSGYGNIALKTLMQGNEVIANDISINQLLSIRHSAKDKELLLDKLYLNYSPFPEATIFANNSLSAVMLHRVIHFLSPAQIEEGINKVEQWLIPGGKVFIVVMAPQHKEFSDWFLPIYEQKWQAGDHWPGTNLEIQKALPDQAYNLPKYLHVMDERPLKRALEDLNFTIEKSDFISLKSFAKKASDRDGKEAFGIIAIKNIHHLT